MNSGADESGGPSNRRRVSEIDLGSIVEALNDHDGSITWWFDATTGDAIPDVDGDINDEDELDGELSGHDLIPIDSEGSHEAYQDMERFASFVGDRVVGRRLERALEGRGAFRRFKDELYSLPEFYRERWFEYSRWRNEERAIDWLRYRGVIDEEDAGRESAERARLAVAVLDALEAQRGLRVDVGDAPGRWTEVIAAIERGCPVEIVRNGEPFAVVTPDD